jgi:hypothetical protein
MRIRKYLLSIIIKRFNVVYKRVAIISESPHFSWHRINEVCNHFSLYYSISDSIKESRIVLAVQAIRTNSKLTVFKVNQLYNVFRSILYNRFDGKYVRRDSISNSRKLNDIEKECILYYILKIIN